MPSPEAVDAPRTAGPAAPGTPGHSPAGGLPRWLRHLLTGGLHLAFDGGAVVLAYLAAYSVRFHSEWWTSRFVIVGGLPGWELYERLLWAVVPLWLAVFFYSARLYTRPWMGASDRFLRILKGAALGTLATLAATYIFSRLEYSRLMILLAGPAAAGLVCFSQFLVLELDGLLARFERTSPLLIVGGGRVVDLLRANLLERHPGLRIVECAGVPGAGELLALAARTGAASVVLARSEHSRKEILELAEACESAGLEFTMLPDLLELRLGEVQMDDSLGLPAYRLQHTSLTRANFLSKRVFDTLFALAVFTVFGLPLLLIALLIRLDSKGPALYKQKRIGLKNRTFDAFKFRTMVVDAEKSLDAVRGLNAQTGGFFKAKSDPRVTRVGRWLRRFSLDEFPQFINVLRGEMSVVGPRPLAVNTGEIEELVKNFGTTARKRLNTLPGITGLWQVSGRSDISAEQRFALDMYYIEHWSLGLDLEIILKTVPAMISARGAY
ncbi:MAG: sugar transferase [Elusimicrobiota bacterium]